MSSHKKTKKNREKSKLEIIFDKVLEKSYSLRKNNPTNFDGQGFWQPIKKLLEPLDHYHAKKWKKINKNKTRKIMLLPEYSINGYEDKLINENNHFIIQQVRIPLKEKPTIKKIVQIALNIGQYKGTNQGNFVYGVKFTDILQFIYKNDIMELSKHISNDIVDSINSI